MGQGFSLSDENLNKLYDGTAEKGGVGQITQGGWTITVTNCGPQINGIHVSYSMTTERNGTAGGKYEIILSVRTSHNEGDVKAKLRNEINLRIKNLTNNLKL